MKRLLLILALVGVVGIVGSSAQTSPCTSAERPVQDPVCGLCVAKDPGLSVAYKGTTYYFCSTADAEKFRKDPAKYAGKK